VFYKEDVSVPPHTVTQLYLLLHDDVQTVLIFKYWKEFSLCVKDKSSHYVLLTVHLDIIVERNPNLMHNLFLIYFVNLYMFRAYLGPSSGGTSVYIQHLVFIILFR